MGRRYSNETIRAFYPIVRDAALERIPKTEAIWQLREQHGLNANSARDFVETFVKMLRGELYQRLNTVFGTELYLEMIERDFGPAALARAVESVRKHLSYYEQVPRGGGQPGVRRVLDRFVRSASPVIELAEVASQLDAGQTFDLSSQEDARRKTLASIVRRQGQPAFRANLMRAYGGRCAVTGCELAVVLDAAHILGYRGPQTNHTANGLLLRGDVHTLFDLGLLAVDPATMTLLTADTLAGSNYAKLRGRRLRLPAAEADWPDRAVLAEHRSRSGL